MDVERQVGLLLTQHASIEHEIADHGIPDHKVPPYFTKL